MDRHPRDRPKASLTDQVGQFDTPVRTSLPGIFRFPILTNTMPTTTKRKRKNTTTGRPIGRPPGPPTKAVSARVTLDLRTALWKRAEADGVPPQRLIMRYLTEGLARDSRRAK